MAKKTAEVAEHEQVILEPELEEALKNATDAEMCDIAGEANTFAIGTVSSSISPSIRSVPGLSCSGHGAGAWNQTATSFIDFHTGGCT